MADRNMFPILHDEILKSIPWDVIRPHEKQAWDNHYQSLSRLAERGGLSVAEALSVILDKPFTNFKSGWARAKLMCLLWDFEQTQAAQTEGRPKGAE